MSMIKRGDRVKVEFISESATEFSGKTIEGVGTVDRFEDGYVFGQLDSGQPFMCPKQFVCVINQDIETEFQDWIKTTPEFQTLIFQHGTNLFIRRDGQYEILTVRLARRLWGIIHGLHFTNNVVSASAVEGNKRIHDLEFYVRQFLFVLSSNHETHREALPKLICHLNHLVNPRSELEKALRGERG